MKKNNWILLIFAITCLTFAGCAKQETATTESTETTMADESASAEMAETTEEMEKTLDQRLDELERNLDELGQKLESAGESTDTALTKIYRESVNELKTSVTEARAEFDALAEKTGDELDQAEATANQSIEVLEQRVNELKQKIDGEPETGDMESTGTH